MFNNFRDLSTERGNSDDMLYACKKKGIVELLIKI